MKKKTIEILFYFFFIIFLLGVVFVIIYNNKRAIDDTPTFLNYESFIVTSGSMEKTISPGDLIIAAKDNRYIVGDIIVFTKNNVTTTHRLVAIETIDSETYYITKGDNNPTNDIDTIVKSEILGKVVFIIPYLGIIINFLRTSTGILIFLVIPSFILFIYYFQKVFSDILELKKPKEGERS